MSVTLNKTATVRRMTTALGTSGFPTKSVGSTTTVVCSIQPASMGESRTDRHRERETTTATIYYRTGTIADGNPLAVDDEVIDGSLTYRVTSGEQDQGGRGRWVAANLELVEG